MFTSSLLRREVKNNALAFLNEIQKDFNKIEEKKKARKRNMKTFLKQRKLI